MLFGFQLASEDAHSFQAQKKPLRRTPVNRCWQRKMERPKFVGRGRMGVQKFTALQCTKQQDGEDSVRKGKRSVKVPAPRFISTQDARRAFEQLGGTGDVWSSFIQECAIGSLAALEASILSFEECFSCLLLCGKGHLTGCVGLALASALKTSPSRKHFNVAVVAVNSSATECDPLLCGQEEWDRLLQSARADGVEFMDDLPATFEFYYDFVIDAISGTEQGTESFPRSDQVSDLIHTLSSCEKPLACIDVPIGWDKENGPSSDDLLADNFLKPDVMISIGAPKRPVRFFNGAWHFVISSGAQKVLQIGRGSMESGPELDFYPIDTDLGYNLISSELTKFRWGTETGQIYGGGFMATTFTKRSRRRWVDPDEMEDIFDDLD